MTSLLILIIIALAIIAGYQIAKVCSLASRGVQGGLREVATERNNKINGYLMIAFLVFLYGLILYGFAVWGKVILDKPASEHGFIYDSLLYLSLIIIFVVQIIMQALIFVFSYKYRGRKARKALHFADNDKLEFVWTIIPVIVLACIMLYGLWAWNNIMSSNNNVKDNPMVVELYAQQFNWKVRYSGNDNVLGDANVRFLGDYEGKNITGIDSVDPNGKDDVVVTTELHLPVNRKVLFKMRSQDVLHSAYFPEFRAQMNCVPGMITEFAFTPVFTTKEMREDPKIIAKVKRINAIRDERRANGETLDPWEFDYTLICNKICGASHYQMKMKVVVETQEEFDSWMAEQQTFGQMIADTKQ